ncbi:MAG: hypothetical protein VB817_06595 [Pirellulaceae bacterium]
MKQSGDGSFHLSPSTAELEGENMQLDLENNLVHGWKKTDDLVCWKIDVVKPGYFTMKIEYAAEAPWEGGVYKFQLDDEEPKSMEVFSLGSRSQFRVDEKHLRIQGTGVHSFTLWADTLSGDELMVLKSIELVPSSRK